jgi:hypothetical protein
MNDTSHLGYIKSRIQAAQIPAVFTVSTELFSPYWEVGQLLEHRKKAKGWGNGTLPRLAMDLSNDFPELKRFSERKLDCMVASYREYFHAGQISPMPVANLTPGSPFPHSLPIGQHSTDQSEKGFL